MGDNWGLKVVDLHGNKERIYLVYWKRENVSFVHCNLPLLECNSLIINAYSLCNGNAFFFKYWPDLNIIWHNCSFCDPLQMLIKLVKSLKNMAYSTCSWFEKHHILMFCIANRWDKGHGCISLNNNKKSMVF